MSSELETREFITRLFLESPRWPYRRIAREANICRNSVSGAIEPYKEDLRLLKKLVR